MPKRVLKCCRKREKCINSPINNDHWLVLPSKWRLAPLVSNWPWDLPISRLNEHLTPDFTAINCQRTIPVLVDNGFVLLESRSICAYLVDRYGKPDDSLYPRDPQLRALVNQRLYFDMGTVCINRWATIYMPWICGTATEFFRMRSRMEIFNTLLEGRTYATGSTFTITRIMAWNWAKICRTWCGGSTRAN